MQKIIAFDGWDDNGNGGLVANTTKSPVDVSIYGHRLGGWCFGQVDLDDPVVTKNLSEGKLRLIKTISTKRVASPGVASETNSEAPKPKRGRKPKTSTENPTA